VNTNSGPYDDPLKFGSPDKKKLISSIHLSQASAASVNKKSDDDAKVGSDLVHPGGNSGDGGNDNLADLTVRFKRAVGGKESKKFAASLRGIGKINA
jgi:hypothetical protein